MLSQYFLLITLTDLIKKSRYFTAIVIFIFLLIISSTPAKAKLFDGPVDKLPVIDRVALRKGSVVLTGEEGNYLCRILVDGSIDDAWKVLTDYDNFEAFLPGVTTSQLVQNQGNHKIFEQINLIKTLMFRTEARIRLSITEDYPQKIVFNIVDGDVEDLNGTWLLEPVSLYPSAPPSQVLITHQVEVQPNSQLGKLIFYRIYENRLSQTLSAIKKEVEARYLQKLSNSQV